MTSAHIAGVVTDSVRGGALPDALVLLARRTSDIAVSRSATTDSAGRFAFDSLPPGTYVVALESAFLDSLELSPPQVMVTLAAGERKEVGLAIPSGAALRSLVCPTVVLPPGTGAVGGSIQDAVDEKPLSNAALTVGWSETLVDRATLRASTVPQAVEARTDSLGRFLICGVPTDTYLDVRASAPSHREAVLQLVVPDDAGVGHQFFVLRPDAPRTDSGALASRASEHGDATAAVTSGALGGAVYGRGAPLPRVQVQRLGDTSVVVTDSLGRFYLGAVLLGTQQLELRRIGYLPRQLTVQVRPGRNETPDVQLTPVATLDSVRVVAQRPVYREFETRAKAASFGHFLRAEDIARRKPLLTSDLLRQMPGFAVVRTSTSDLDVEVVQPRGMTSWSKPAPCEANIIIDGVPHQKINWIDPGSIGAMEIYPGTATGPVQYRSACGTILIWTKRQ